MSKAASTFILLSLAAPLTAQIFPPARGQEAERLLCSVVGKRTITEITKEVASTGNRAPGSASANAALQWCSEWSSKLGLKPETVAETQAATWAVQSFSCVLKAQGEVVLTSARPANGSPALPATVLPIVEESRDGDVDGKAVVLVRGRPSVDPARLADLARRGARVVLCGWDDDAVPPDAAPLWEPTKPLPLPVVAIGARCTRAALAAGNDAKLSIEIVVARARGTVRSMIARVPGRADRGRVVVAAGLPAFGGGPGASDAAAVATVLAMARSLHLSTKRDIEPLPFEVVFAVLGDGQRSLARLVDGLEGLRGVVEIASVGKSARSCVFAALTDPAGARSGPTAATIAPAALRSHAGKRGFWKSWRPWPRPEGLFPFSNGARVRLSTTPLFHVRPDRQELDGDVCAVARTSADEPKRAAPAADAVLCARAGLVLLVRLGGELSR